MNLLKLTQRVDEPLDRVFPFFSKPENLAEMTPAWLDFQILTPSPISMEKGTIIDYQIGLGPIPTRWRTLISCFEPPFRFVDEQLNGPYSFWHHTHRFESVANGTLLTDEVRYLLPFGVLGHLAHGVLIKSQLKKIFTHRHAVMREKFGGNPEDPVDLKLSRI